MILPTPEIPAQNISLAASIGSQNTQKALASQQETCTKHEKTGVTV
jgi:hypothetical protein